MSYQNVAAAIDWLTRVFGFTEHYRYGSGPVDGAQLHPGDAWIMVSRARPGHSSPAQIGCETQSLTIFVPEVDAHFERAKSAGAKIVDEVRETMYGERQYAAEDLEGHHWLFSCHAKVSPEERGAAVAGG